MSTFKSKSHTFTHYNHHLWVNITNLDHIADRSFSLPQVKRLSDKLNPNWAVSHYNSEVNWSVQSKETLLCCTCISVAVDILSVGKCKSKACIVTVKLFTLHLLHLTTVHSLILCRCNSLCTCNIQQSAMYEYKSDSFRSSYSCWIFVNEASQQTPVTDRAANTIPADSHLM